MELSWPPNVSKLAQEGSNLASRCFQHGLLFPHASPMMALLGPPWPCMGGPRGYLEAVWTMKIFVFGLNVCNKELEDGSRLWEGVQTLRMMH